MIVAVCDRAVCGGIGRLTEAAGNNSNKQVNSLQSNIHNFVVNISFVGFFVRIFCFSTHLYTLASFVHKVEYIVSIIVSLIVSNGREGFSVIIDVPLTASARRTS